MKKILNGNEIDFKKKFGQNFLKDENILNKIIVQADVNSSTTVIEIGVGSGNLTKKLVEAAKNVIGYEIDESLKPIISQKLDIYPNLKIIYDDFLKRNVKADLKNYDYEKLYVVANLPYYITTPIITKLIEDEIKIDKMVIMVQKEVGDRLNAKPDSKEYNSLTIFINYYFKVKKLFDVSRNAFVPKPNVDSVIIELAKRENEYLPNNRELFFKLVRDAFRYKRKTLKNNLKDYDLESILKVLKKYELDLSVRAEHLTIEQFIDIANNI